ncbi:MAG: chemotaxis protein CheX [Candidatus Competibacteraceae bacterium]|nr:chemotaxis protein CheX [Candidatus Competibacteraceae bacterium]
MLQTTPKPDAIALSANVLLELAESIWSSLLELDIQRSDDPVTEWPCDQPLLTGRVVVDGDWQGSILLVCPKAIACKAAAAMFGVSPSEVAETDLSDAMGELTHMLSGNLKSLLPTPCRLSQPSVGEGYNITTEERIMGQVFLRSEGLPLQIILFEREKKS